MHRAEALAPAVKKQYEDFNYYQAVELVMEFVRDSNALQTEEEPWKLMKTGHTDKAKVLNLIGLESLRISAILLQPVIPHLSAVILTKLGLSATVRWSDAQKFAWTDLDLKKCRFSNEKVVLFKKLSHS